MYPEKRDIHFFRFSAPYLGDITIPAGTSTKNVTEQLKGKIADGTYCIGSLINLQRFEKIVLQNGKIYKEEVHVSGSKIDLESIPNDMYNQHKKFMRLGSDNDYSKLSGKDTIKHLRRSMNLILLTLTKTQTF